MLFTPHNTFLPSNESSFAFFIPFLLPLLPRAKTPFRMYVYELMAYNEQGLKGFTTEC